MSLEVRWQMSTTASALHVASAILAGRTPSDTGLAAVERETLAIGDDLAALGLDVAPLVENLIPCSVHFDAPKQAAEVALTKLMGPGAAAETAQAVARRLVPLELSYSEARPSLIEDLERDSAWLCQEWEGVAERMLTAIARLTEAAVIAPVADVILVEAICGGGGAAHPLFNALRIEVVQQNSQSELPEVVRLAWLWSQLNLDLPHFQGLLLRDQLLEIGRWATLVPVLAAASECDLIGPVAQTLPQAFAHWKLDAAANSVGVSQEILASWWGTFATGEVPWTVGLGALAQMLEKPASPPSEC